jgi:DNA-binding NarL/FixJ family response regulator
MHAMTRVFIVDDHPILRKGLREIISQEPDMEVCGEAEDAATSLKGVIEAKPDIAIVDISLKDSNGLDLVKDLSVRHPGLKVLVLSMYEEDLYAERALRAGARGYIMKQEAAPSLVGALRRIIGGRIYLSESMSERVLDKVFEGGAEATRSPLETLSDRELEVFRLIGQGIGTRLIAERLHLSVKTIESYRARLKEKLHAKNANELMIQAVQWVQSQSSSQ